INTGRPTFTFSSNESGATFQCRIDSAAFASCTSPLQTAPLSDGSHTLEVRAIDAAGNVDATPDARTFRVDTTAPDTAITVGPTGVTDDPTPTLSFSSSESGLFECRVDGAAFAPCASPYTT